ncbi:Spermidine synthase [Propionibacterium freudenreichii subsp. freudenreichii]|nr:fused MFS/spermidine synthase [Propionibacterium freudenreichii]AJQ91535.1 Spermidine synthase [Propionibacterium freudenreichii subsp. freudenreichii]MDK9343361.1 fused MFS/spermidine synthase [Propionibacterium freudenreichii]CEG90451.1 spermidine synthase [Propionibacterium freudenreichii]
MAHKHQGRASAAHGEVVSGASGPDGAVGGGDATPSDHDVLHVQPDKFVPGAFVVSGGGVEHSFVDPNDPTHLEFPYMQRISEAIDVWVPAGERPRVIHVGGAGMSLARYVAFTRPTSPQIVLEPDERLTEEVRRELPLPQRSGIKVRPQDGRTGLAVMPADYADMIIVDAFAHLSVPGELVTGQAFGEYDRVLRDGGLLAINVTDTAPFTWTHRVLVGANRSFSELSVCAEPGVFKGRRMGNVVILCSHLELPMSALMSRGRGDAFPYRWIFGEELDRWRGAPEPFDDAAPQGSPVSWDARTHFE